MPAKKLPTTNSVTIYEVAKAAGVSPKTAARILGGTPGRPYNEKLVQEAAEKLGYIRNQQAASLRSGKSGLIGLVVPDIQNPYYPVFFQAVHDAAVSAGYQILLSSTFGKNSEEVHSLRMFERNRVEGIILNAAETEDDEECDAVLARFLSRGVPVIVAGRPLRKLPADQICLQNKAGLVKSTSYLLKIGRRRIAFVSGSAQAQASKQRYEGYASALKEHSLPVDRDLVSYGAFNADSGFQQARALLALPSPPDAFVATNDMLALGVIKACQSSGLNVPRDIAVIGFDDVPLAQLVAPALTTLRQPTTDIARDCVNLIVDRIRTKDSGPPRQLIYEPELIIRDSA